MPAGPDGDHGTRRIAALLALDVVGYSRQMGQDEVGTLDRVMTLRREVVEPAIAAHRGRVFKHTGDGALAEFTSVVDALAAARAIRDGSRGLLELRIAVHLGDVIVAADDLFGEGVNIVARLEPLAQPGGIVLSGPAFDQVRGRLQGRFRDRGPVTLKNIADPVRVIDVDLGDVPVVRAGASRSRRALVAGGGIVAALVVGATGLWLGRGWLGADAGPSMPPTVAVLPFATAGGETGEAWLGEALATELTGALSRFAEFGVIAPQAAARFRDRAIDLDAIRTELGATYVVTGTTRQGAGRVRVGVQLVELPGGIARWSQSYDEPVDALQQVEARLSADVAGALALRIGRLEELRARDRPADQADAYVLYLRGRTLGAAVDRKSNREARGLLRRSVELEPGFAPAWAGLGWVDYLAVVNGWVEFVEDVLDRAESSAHRALQLDPDHVGAWRVLAFVHLQRGRNDLALEACNRALRLNPSDAASYEIRGALLMWAGEAEAAIESISRARRFDPELGPIGRVNLGLAELLAGRDAAAVATLESALAQPLVPILAGIATVGLTAGYARLGRAEDASRLAAELRRRDPFLSLETFIDQFRSEADRKFWRDAFAKAGLMPLPAG